MPPKVGLGVLNAMTRTKPCVEASTKDKAAAKRKREKQGWRRRAAMINGLSMNQTNCGRIRKMGGVGL